MATRGAVRSEDAGPPVATVFGPFSLAGCDGRAIPLTSRRARALLAMLCIAPDGALDRHHVSRILWPGRFPAQAKASLRQCLLSLDRALEEVGIDVIDASRTRIVLKPGSLSCDLSALEAALDEGRAAEACGLLTAIGGRPLLDQFDLGDAFQAWLEATRKAVEARLAKRTELALLALEERGDLSARDRLRTAWAARGRVVARPESRRIAVLPFEQFDAIGGELFLADGVADELSARLGSIEGLALVGRTSVQAVTDNGKTLPAIARALDVTHLVEGTVHRFTDGIRIAIRLINGTSGTEVWSDRWDGTLADAMARRQPIGTNVIAGLCKVLGVAMKPAPVRTMTAEREAYALYLQGRAMTLRVVGEGTIGKGIELLERALEIDPGFSECWAALAEAHLYHAVFTPTLDRLERGRWMAGCARKAIELDPANGHALAMLGMHEFVSGNTVGALDLAFEAHRLEPANIDVNVRLGSFLLYLGLAREALPYIEFAIDRDPAHGRTYAALASAHFCLGDLDKAIAAAETMATLGIPPLWLAVIVAASGERERAVEIYRDTRFHLGTMIMRPPGIGAVDDSARDAYFEMAAKGVCSGDPGARLAYCALLEGLHRTMADPYDQSLVWPALWMGHAELLMKMLGEQTNIANVSGLMLLWADQDPINRTWQHPGFMAFARSAGYVAAWEKYGWPEVLRAERRANSRFFDAPPD
jgi:TolB-like protein